jgi:PAS domain S-box-containing protein
MMKSQSRRLLLQILVPLVAVGLAALLAHIPALKSGSSLFLFLAAVIVSIRLGGGLSGLIATVLSTAIAAYYFLAPVHSFSIQSGDDLFRLTIFVVVCLMILSLHTSRGKTDIELKASEQRLMLALDSAHMGVWDYNLLNRKFWWSPTLEVIYGRTDGNFPGSYGRFFGFIHFDDQPMFNRAITRTIDEGTDYEVDHRIVLPDQSVRWVNTRGRVFFNQKSRAERIVGVTTDITAKKKTERQQQLSGDAADDPRMSTVA